jgi:hypothetical protein
MKPRMLLVFLPFLSLVFSPFSARAQAPQWIELPVQRVFFPETGYTENDDIQLVVEGELPDPCYELGPQSFSQDTAGTITAHPTAWRHSSDVCDTGDLLGESPYSLPSSLGRLKAGDYRVAFSPDGETPSYRDLHVGKWRAPEDLRRGTARATSADIPNSGLQGQTVEITLRGFLASACSQLSNPPEINPQGDTLVITPEETAPGTCSDASPRAFEIKISLGVLSPGEHLVHVRSRDGKAIQKTLQVIRTQRTSMSSKAAPLKLRT